MTKLLTIIANPFNSMQHRLFLLVVMPILLLTGITIATGLAITYQQTAAALRGDLEMIGRAIRIPISNALAQQDEDTMQAHLATIFSIRGVFGASVYNPQGERIAAYGLTERDLSDSKLATRVVETGLRQEGYRSVAGQVLYSHFVPLFDRSGQILGLLQISRHANDFEKSFRTLSWIAVLSWLALAIISVAIMWYGHARAVGKPLRDLVDSMRNVAAGHAHHRASIAGPVEVQEVAQGLNTMLDDIQRAEKAVLQQQQQLKAQQAMATVGQLASGVAHELGAPLNVIDGRAQRLLRDNHNDDEKRQLAAIRGQVNRLSHMVKQLQAFAYTPVSEVTAIKVKQLVSQAFAALSHEWQPPTPQPALTPCSHDGWLQVDVARMELALVNLLRNAVQAAAKAVSVDIKTAEHHVIISISDDGPGLPSAFTTEQLLQPFISTKSAGKGTGLGLAIVHAIVTEHHGHLSLSDSPQGGCEVRLVLPMTGER